MINTLIFDIGGVFLTPSEKVTPYILSQIFNAPCEVTVSEYKKSLPLLRNGSKKIKDLAKDIAAKYPADVNIIDNFERIYINYYEKQALIDRDMLDFLATKKDSYLLIALSNMLDLHVRSNSERNLFKYFHKLFISSETGLVKPDHETFLNMLTDIQKKPDECIFIDEKEENVEAARTQKIVSYRFDTLLNLRGFLEKQGVE